MTPVRVRAARDSDLSAIERVAHSAFGPDEGPVIRRLVADLLVDETARPVLSLVATSQDDVVGHVLFTHVRVDGPDGADRCAILEPLCVDPHSQGQGIGGELVRAGLARLAAADVELVFVLGHPGYYPRFGFVPAGVRGLDAPHPIPTEHADAWMVTELRPGALRGVRGRVACADALDAPEHWRE